MHRKKIKRKNVLYKCKLQKYQLYKTINGTIKYMYLFFCQDKVYVFVPLVYHPVRQSIFFFCSKPKRLCILDFIAKELGSLARLLGIQESPKVGEPPLLWAYSNKSYPLPVVQVIRAWGDIFKGRVRSPLFPISLMTKKKQQQTIKVSVISHFTQNIEVNI